MTLTSGLGDIPFTNQIRLPLSIPYSISKSAVNMLIAKFQAAYGDKGILFLGISPGLVATSETPRETPKGGEVMVKKFLDYAPDFKGPITPKESVDLVLKVIESKSLENGDGGKYFSHFGNDRWL